MARVPRKPDLEHMRRRERRTQERLRKKEIEDVPGGGASALTWAAVDFSASHGRMSGFAGARAPQFAIDTDKELVYLRGAVSLHTGFDCGSDYLLIPGAAPAGVRNLPVLQPVYNTNQLAIGFPGVADDGSGNGQIEIDIYDPPTMSLQTPFASAGFVYLDGVFYSL